MSGWPTWGCAHVDKSVLKHAVHCTYRRRKVMLLTLRLAHLCENALIAPACLNELGASWVLWSMLTTSVLPDIVALSILLWRYGTFLVELELTGKTYLRWIAPVSMVVHTCGLRRRCSLPPKLRGHQKSSVKTTAFPGPCTISGPWLRDEGGSGLSGFRTTWFLTLLRNLITSWLWSHPPWLQPVSSLSSSSRFPPVSPPDISD